MESRSKTTLIAVAVALLTALLVAPAEGKSRYRVGIGEQSAALFSQQTFVDTRIKRVRYLVPWDWRHTDGQRAEVAGYLAAARAARKDVFVTFTARRGCWDGRYSRAKECRAPSVRKFRKSFRNFRREYPWVRTYAPWNEANHASQPISRKPKRAAKYYNVVRKHCRGCTIVALDVLDQSGMVRYVKRFRRKARGKPRRWGLHNYSDVNRKRSKGTRSLLRAVRGQVWLTETGGIVTFEPNFPHSPNRAALRTKYMFRLAKRYSKRRRGMKSRITRIYPYAWFGEDRGARWDAGLVTADGTPRKGYRVFKRKVRRLSK